MKHLLTFIALFCWMTAVPAQNEKPFVIPELKEWKGGNGTFTLDSQTWPVPLQPTARPSWACIPK